MRSMEGPWEFTDGGGHSLHVDERWVPSHVVRAGRLHEPGGRMLRDLLDRPTSDVSRSSAGT